METPKSSWKNKVPFFKKIKRLLGLEIDKNLNAQLTWAKEYNKQMIAKRASLSQLPETHPEFLQLRLNQNGRVPSSNCPTIAVDLLPKHYQEMDLLGFSLDFLWFEAYAKTKKNAWEKGKLGKI